jgi:DNA-binding NtrC family response regulator
MAKQMRVLLVDDDPTVRDALCRVLAFQGYVVVAVSNGREAVRQILENHLVAVLLDVDTRAGDRWGTFHRVTAANPRLPVIAITSRAREIKAPTDAAVHALMEKPLDIALLLQTLDELISKAAEPQALGSGPAGLLEGKLHTDAPTCKIAE